MLRVDHDRWGQTQTDLREMALNAAHARSRERFLALHDIAEGACATQVAARTGRHPQTVMGWLHAYNQHGPEALSYQRTAGSAGGISPPAAHRTVRKPLDLHGSSQPYPCHLAMTGDAEYGRSSRFSVGAQIL